MIEITDTQKIGVGLAGFGMTFLVLGVLLLFDKGLLAIGNILFISGLACVIGIQRTIFFFFQRHKVKASAAFFGGIVLVLLGWPVVGMVAEIYGFLLLFRGFLPAAVNFLRMVPVLGSLLNLPIISGIVSRIAGDNGRNMLEQRTLLNDVELSNIPEAGREESVLDVVVAAAAKLGVTLNFGNE